MGYKGVLGNNVKMEIFFWSYKVVLGKNGVIFGSKKFFFEIFEKMTKKKVQNFATRGI